MRLSEFLAVHRERIHMDLRHEKLSNDVTIKEVYITTLKDLGAVRTAWYWPQERDCSDYLDISKPSLRVSDVAYNLSLVTEKHRQIIIDKANKPEPLSHMPAYALPNSEYLLLDGNHRAVAAMRKNRLPIALDVLYGPIRPSVLPDLWRWTPVRIANK
jgi:hypothetical protein